MDREDRKAFVSDIHRIEAIYPRREVLETIKKTYTVLLKSGHSISVELLQEEADILIDKLKIPQRFQIFQLASPKHMVSLPL